MKAEYVASPNTAPIQPSFQSNSDSDFFGTADLANETGGAVKADISEDRASGRSRGFGTVLFETGEQAAAAIEVRCKGSRLRDAQNAAPQAFAVPVAAKLGCRGSAWARL